MMLDQQPDGAWSFEWTESQSDTPSSPRGFNEILVSWNLSLEPGAGAVVEARVWPMHDGGWSPWLRIGSAGEPSRAPACTEFKDGPDHPARVDVDYFTAGRRYQRHAIRVRAWPATQGSLPPARIVRLAYWRGDTIDRQSVPARSLREAQAGRNGEVRLPVPFRSQRTDDPSLSGRLCSPTSLAMVLEFHGSPISVAEAAHAVWDADHDLYGNWPRNVQAAFEHGVGGYLTRFNHWSQVRGHLERGEPIIASIRAPRGVLTGAPYQHLDSGHLIVLRGLDGRGGVCVNDPAAGTPEDGQRIYRMDELSKAWFELGNGTAYVLIRPADSAP